MRLMPPVNTKFNLHKIKNMARTIGAVGMAKYVGVPVSKLREAFGDNAIIYVSIKHHGPMLGVDRNAAPRVETIMLADAGVAPVAAVNPVTPIGVVPVVANPEPEEEPAGFKVDFSKVD